MAQQTQTAKPQTSSVQMQPASQPTGQTPPMEEKKSIFKKWWFWVILVIVGLLIGAGIYYLIG